MTTTDNDRALAQWAEDPTAWGAPTRVLHGPDAAAYGRGLLEAAGIDVAAVERSAGRPRVGRDEHAQKGVRSPRVNVAITRRQEQLLDHLAHTRGQSRSQLVREALDDYLSHTG